MRRLHASGDQALRISLHRLTLFIHDAVLWAAFGNADSEPASLFLLVYLRAVLRGAIPHTHHRCCQLIPLPRHRLHPRRSRSPCIGADRANRAATSVAALNVSASAQVASATTGRLAPKIHFLGSGIL
eukprot:364546-Chlamydomonas_euryale.AAC.10